MKGTNKPPENVEHTAVIEMTFDEARTLENYLDGLDSPDWDESDLGNACERLSHALYEARATGQP